MLVFLVNPNAGGERGYRVFKKLERRLLRTKTEYQVYVTGGTGEARQLAAKLTEAPDDKELTLVAVGGCAGTLVRAALERAWPAAPGHLPTTTLAINVVGALALGLLLGSLGEQRPRLRLVLGTGVLGALTTHSTFILESHRILASGEAGGHPALGAAYLLGSMAIGLVAAGLGLWLAGRVGRRGRQGGPSLGEAS